MAFATLLMNPFFVLSFVSTLVYVLYSQWRKRITLPDIPWINRDPGLWFSKVRARISTNLHYKDAVQYAYKKVGGDSGPPQRRLLTLFQYSENSESCIISSLSEDIIILPADSVNWIINQPDSTLCSIDVLTTQLQTKYTFSQPHIVHNTTHHDTIKGDLTRQLASLTKPMIEELAISFDHFWGNDTSEWKEVCVFETIMQIVAQTSNRVFVGAPMCTLGGPVFSNPLTRAVQVVTRTSFTTRLDGHRLYHWQRPSFDNSLSLPNQSSAHSSVCLLIGITVATRRFSYLRSCVDRRATQDP